ncbi:hypothetical protein [Leptospira kmetyi]|uniref:hypothetical protein n=1 Tax=Leptospira kmetyi TaxID=408139 RepID=UPI000F632D44|nr:hypothetical protein [Leptospira kmetyi]
MFHFDYKIPDRKNVFSPLQKTVSQTDASQKERKIRNLRKRTLYVDVFQNSKNDGENSKANLSETIR